MSIEYKSKEYNGKKEYKGKEYKAKMMKPESDDGTRRSKYDRIEANLPIGIKDLLAEYADRKGVSIAKYITIALYAQMDKDDGKEYEKYIYSIKLAQGRFDASKISELRPGCVAYSPKAVPITIMCFDNEEAALNEVKKYQTTFVQNRYEVTITEFFALKERVGRDGIAINEPDIIYVSDFPDTI